MNNDKRTSEVSAEYGEVQDKARQEVMARTFVLIGRVAPPGVEGQNLVITDLPYNTAARGEIEIWQRIKPLPEPEPPKPPRPKQHIAKTDTQPKPKKNKTTGKTPPSLRIRQDEAQP